MLGGIRTLRSTCPSPAWESSSAPGCSASSAMTRTNARESWGSRSVLMLRVDAQSCAPTCFRWSGPRRAGARRWRG
jgi:hypothetical protein